MDIVIKENALADSVPLPVDGLSAATQETIRAYSDGYQCSRDFVTASVFTAVSAAIGERVRTDDGRYRNYLSLFLCLVAPSGSNKTTPMREILRPLIIRNASNYELFKEAMQACFPATDNKRHHPGKQEQGVGGKRKHTDVFRRDCDDAV